MTQLLEAASGGDLFICAEAKPNWYEGNRDFNWIGEGKRREAKLSPRESPISLTQRVRSLLTPSRSVIAQSSNLDPLLQCQRPLPLIVLPILQLFDQLVRHVSAEC
jgi:hypothetical protein